MDTLTMISFHSPSIPMRRDRDHNGEQAGLMGRAGLILLGLGPKTQARHHSVVPRSRQPCEVGIISVLLIK